MFLSLVMHCSGYWQVLLCSVHVHSCWVGLYCLSACVVLLESYMLHILCISGMFVMPCCRKLTAGLQCKRPRHGPAAVIPSCAVGVLAPPNVPPVSMCGMDEHWVLCWVHAVCASKHSLCLFIPALQRLKTH